MGSTVSVPAVLDDLFARALEHSTDLIALGDRRDHITFANAAFLRTLGYRAEDVLGRPGNLVLSPRNPPEVLRAMRAGLERDASWSGECLFQRRDGSDLPVALTTSSIRGEGGQLLGTIGIAQDISARRRAEAALLENDQRFRQIAENLPQALFVRATDPARVIYVSPAFERIWERPVAVAYASLESIHSFIHPDDRDRATAELRRAGQGAPVDVHYRILRPNGEVRYIDSQLRPLFNAAGRCYRVVGIADDVTEKRSAAAHLALLNERLRAALAAAETDAREDAVLTEMVEMLQSCHGLEEACQIAQQSLHSLFPDAPGALALMRASRNVLETRTAWGASPSEPIFAPDECWALRRGKGFSSSRHDSLHCRHVHAEAYACVPLSAQGDIFGLLCQSAPDPAQLPEMVRLAEAAGARIALALANVRLRETLRNQSIRDPLTGLYNRRFLESTLERELERAIAKQVPLSVAILDLDHFKRFNDGFGHNAGDLVLREVAETLRTRMRAADCCCRYGGEEIVILLHETPIATALERLTEMREAVKALAVGDRGQTFGKVSISGGLAAFPGHGNSMATLLKAADVALYRAKQEGRDRIIVA